MVVTEEPGCSVLLPELMLGLAAQAASGVATAMIPAGVRRHKTSLPRGPSAKLHRMVRLCEAFAWRLARTLTVKDRRAWRAWLARKHATAQEIWLVYHHKASGRGRISYNDAVEEALCYGWIDSTVKGIDETR